MRKPILQVNQGRKGEGVKTLPKSHQIILTEPKGNECDEILFGSEVPEEIKKMVNEMFKVRKDENIGKDVK